MVSSNNLLLFIVGVTVCFANPDRRFALERVEEKELIKCFGRSRIPSLQCFGQKRRLRLSRNCRKISSGSLANRELDLQLAPAHEYLCALTTFLNSRRTHSDVLGAVVDSGSCSNGYPNVAAAWQQFLALRGDEIRMQPASWQSVNGSHIQVRFTRDDIVYSHAPESLKAVDIVISRTLDDEIYGKYALRITSQRQDEEVVVHETMQATCPSEHKRFFVAGLNNDGREAIRNWLVEPGNTVEFSIKVTSLKRVINGHHARVRHHSNPDLGLKVSAIILHFAESTFTGVPNAGIFFPLPTRRRRRSAAISDSSDGTKTKCHRETYIANYRQNQDVITPDEFDIGECVGSCEEAQRSSVDFRLNATNHALSMIWGKLTSPTPGNAEPTVCCVPISYRRLYLVIRDKRDKRILMSTFVDMMVSEYCGCR